MQYIKTSQVKRTNGHAKTEHHNCVDYDSASIEFRFQTVKIWWILYVPYLSLNTAGLSLNQALEPQITHPVLIIFLWFTKWQRSGNQVLCSSKIPSGKEKGDVSGIAHKVKSELLNLIYCQDDIAITRFMTSNSFFPNFKLSGLLLTVEKAKSLHIATNATPGQCI